LTSAARRASIRASLALTDTLMDERFECYFRPCRRVLAAATLLACASGTAAAATPVEDAFIAGYAAAVLERDFRLSAASLSVHDGVVSIGDADLAGRERVRVVESLTRIKGVRRVEIATRTAVAPAPAPAAAPSGEPAPPVAVAAGGAVAASVRREGIELLPRNRLFEPLSADPRWPHFAASFLRIDGAPELHNAAAVSFGEIFPLLATDAPWGGRWQIGILGSVFALFDTGSPSEDLINNDYFVGVPVEWRNGPWSAQARYLHQSSHLGDEFLLRGTGVKRVNLSFEQADLRLSYDLDESFRLYGGGGRILRSEPHLHPWLFQAGGEYSSPRTLLHGLLRPVAALDLQSREFQDWSPDVSARAGFEIDTPLTAGRKVQLLIEYYNGRSPNGQFLNESIEYYGVGAHFYF
jgi:hypothetical protein